MPERDGGVIPDGPFKGKRVVFAGQDEVDALEDEINEILEAIDMEEALVTDLSRISDFREFGGDEYIDIDGLSETLGVPVAKNDLLVDIAHRMRRVRGSGSNV